MGPVLSASGLATLGDQLSLHGSFSGRGNWLGGLDYSLPLGTDGLRGQAGLNRNNYELGQDFAALGAHGTADVASLGISYPLLRSLSANLRASAGWQHKRLHDEFDQAGTSSRKSADLLPLALAGDYRDDNGVSWGVWTWTGGHLSLDDAQRASDAASARTEGSWSKLNLELARLQDMGSGWSAYARLAAQWASKNLDASEKMLLGGAHGVRAWPSGEATGDEGWLAQMELRWQQAWGEPYAFVDGGHVRINAQPWAAGENSRSISGAGVGLRWNPGLWSFDLALARRNGTREPTSAPGASRVQVWLSAGYRFQ
jgi:hemolysin activation/secretion protein